MTAPGNSLLQITLALAFVIASGYACGRIHQWYRHGLERDRSYREGYDHASRSMFDMAVRARSVAVTAPPAGEVLRQRIGPEAHTAVGASRRRIMAHAAPAGDLRRHAA